MIEPTESESKAELDRLCDAMIAIRGEIQAVAEGRLDRADNPLKARPHGAGRFELLVAAGLLARAGGYPAPWLREHKFWPTVARIDNTYGDRPPLLHVPAARGVRRRESKA